MEIFYLLTLFICTGYAALIVLFVIGWKRTPEWTVPPGFASSVYASIIVPVRNEEANIIACLSSLSGQVFPTNNFEIIIIDDHSSDNTATWVHSLKIVNLNYISLPPGKMGKKAAITEGIKNAKGNLIITTDADCVVGKEWLISISSYCQKYKPAMMVLPVLIHEEKSFFEIVQMQEMTALTASACGSLYYNLPLLCSGANLAYEKEAFTAVNGFEGTEHIPSGDDVFLMHKIHKKFPARIHYIKSPAAAAFTRSEKTFKGMLTQRKRWASKTFHYGLTSYPLWAALLVFTGNFFIFLLGILSVINVKFAFALIATLPLKCIVDYMLLNTAFSFFGKRINFLVFLFASLIYPVYAAIIGIASSFTNYSWKGRTS